MGERTFYFLSGLFDTYVQYFYTLMQRNKNDAPRKTANCLVYSTAILVCSLYIYIECEVGKFIKLTNIRWLCVLRVCVCVSVVGCCNSHSLMVIYCRYIIALALHPFTSLQFEVLECSAAAATAGYCCLADFHINQSNEFISRGDTCDPFARISFATNRFYCRPKSCVFILFHALSVCLWSSRPCQCQHAKQDEITTNAINFPRNQNDK